MPVDAAEGGVGVALPRVFLLGSSADIELSPVEFVSSSRLQVTVPAGIPLGVYGIRVRNPNGNSTTLDAAYEAIEPDDLTITQVVPRFGWTGESTPVEILGGIFQSTPRAFLLTTPETELERVAFLDSSSLFAEVPEGLTPGTYDLRVINPDGSIGVLNSAFTITVDPPPRIDDVTPSNGTTQNDVAVTISGANFPADATVDLVDLNGTLVSAVITTLTPPSVIQATIPTTALSVGNYLVRVTRPSDGAYGEYAVFTVTGPSGNPGPWEDLSDLPAGRRGLSLVAASDDLGRDFLYAVGGQVTDSAGNVVEVYRDVAVAPLNAFGRPGNWGVDSSVMSARRFEPVAWATSGYLFVAGGVDETGTFLDDVERAKVLRSGGAPDNLQASLGAAGSLPGGTWYYRVSATVSDPDNLGGESRASDFDVITVAAGSQVALSWDAPAEGVVTSYNIYRTPVANGALGEERLLEAGIVGLTYVDDGTQAPGLAAPKVGGGLGSWIALGNLPSARGRATVTQGRAPNGAFYGSSYVYIIGGENLGGLRADYEYAVVGSNGFLGAFTTGGALLTDARREPFASLGDARSAPLGIAEPDAFVYVVGGEGPTLGNYTTGIEAAAIQADGSLGAWLTLADGGNAGAAQVSTVAGDYLWFIGGSTGAPSASVSTGEICRTGLGGCAATVAPQLKNVNSTGESLPDPLAQAGGARARGYIYVVGGTTDGDNSVTTVVGAVF